MELSGDSLLCNVYQSTVSAGDLRAQHQPLLGLLRFVPGHNTREQR